MAETICQFRPSRHGTLIRWQIARFVKMAGGDIIHFVKTHPAGCVPEGWRPPAGWHHEKVRLPGGAAAHFLVPPDCDHPDAAILELHGGGYTIGYMRLFLRRSLKLARLGGHVPVLSLDYRLAPENPYPAALDDAMEAVSWLEQAKGIVPEAVVAIGESAGGGLALALAMKLRDIRNKKLCALVLMSPWTNLTCQGGTYESRFAMDPVFGRNDGRVPGKDVFKPGAWYAGSHDPKNPYISPSFGNYADMPPMLVHVGECEMLYDDAVMPHEKALAAGVTSALKVWPGMFHVFQAADPWLRDARKAWREIYQYIRTAVSARAEAAVRQSKTP